MRAVWEAEANIRQEIAGMIGGGLINGASFAFLDSLGSRLFYQGMQGKVEPYSQRALMPGMYYDLASLTKVVGTTTRILQLIEEKRLNAETKVRELLPRFCPEEITVSHLLLHNSGLPAEIMDKASLTEETILNHLYDTLPDTACGQRFCYSDVGFILLGKIIEFLDQTTLEDSFRTHIFQPLGMEHTSYLTNGRLQNYIPTEITGARGCICKEVHDSKARLLGQSGSAGLFSTLEDLVRFVSAFLKRSPVFFSPDIFKLMEHGEIYGRTYGWSAEYGAGILYHTGFTGTSILMNVKQGEAFILLTNRIHPSREDRGFLEKRKRINTIFLNSHD